MPSGWLEMPEYDKPSVLLCVRLHDCDSVAVVMTHGLDITYLRRAFVPSFPGGVAAISMVNPSGLINSPAALDTEKRDLASINLMVQPFL